MGHAATARRWRNRRNTEQVAPTASSRPPATGCGWPPRARARCAAWPCGSPRASRRRCWARRSADCGRRAGTRSTGSAPSADGPCRRRGSHAAAGCDKATPPRARSASGAPSSRDNGRGRCRPRPSTGSRPSAAVEAFRPDRRRSVSRPSRCRCRWSRRTVARQVRRRRLFPRCKRGGSARQHRDVLLQVVQGWLLHTSHHLLAHQSSARPAPQCQSAQGADPTAGRHRPVTGAPSRGQAHCARRPSVLRPP